jgi:hypothetical protein
MNEDDIADENLREKLDNLGAFANKSVFEKELRQAMKEKRKVEIYSQGTYKGIIGYVSQIKHGYVYLDTAVSKVIVAQKDIRRLTVYKPEEQE